MTNPLKAPQDNGATIQVIDALSADFDEIAALQRKAFEGVAGGEQLSAVQTADYYRWKYTLPDGPARIAQVRDSAGMLIAMNSIFPLTLTGGGAVARGWQSCDTATHPSGRGKGYFMKCLNALRETLKEGEVFFGYPNINSAPGFRKLGWQEMGTLQLFAGFIPSFLPSTGVRDANRFDAAQDDLAARLARPEQIMIRRSAAYMNGRYASPQRALYSSFVYEENGRCEGFLVVRTIEMHGLRLCLIMDCHATTDKAERRLLMHAGYWALKQRCLLTLSLHTLERPLNYIACGLFPVPQKLSPRPLILMGQGLGNGTAFIEKKWASHVGDWDGF